MIMKAFLFQQVTRTTCYFLEFVSHARFDTSVHKFVHSQLTEFMKCFLTNVTCIHFDTMVNAFV